MYLVLRPPWEHRATTVASDGPPVVVVGNDAGVPKPKPKKRRPRPIGSQPAPPPGEVEAEEPEPAPLGDPQSTVRSRDRFADPFDRTAQS
jgi:hypothetical protein